MIEPMSPARVNARLKETRPWDVGTTHWDLKQKRLDQQRPKHRLLEASRFADFIATYLTDNADGWSPETLQNLTTWYSYG